MANKKKPKKAVEIELDVTPEPEVTEAENTAEVVTEKEEEVADATPETPEPAKPAKPAKPAAKAAKSIKVEYWARQVRLDGKTLSGEVKTADKKRFLEVCAANGADVDERDWFKKENWEDRVFKKAKVNPKK